MLSLFYLPVKPFMLLFRIGRQHIHFCNKYFLFTAIKLNKVGGQKVAIFRQAFQISDRGDTGA